MEGLEIDVDVKSSFHNFESVVERDLGSLDNGRAVRTRTSSAYVQTSPHLLRDLFEGSLAALDLLVEHLSPLGPTSVGIE